MRTKYLFSAAALCFLLVLSPSTITSNVSAKSSSRSVAHQFALQNRINEIQDRLDSIAARLDEVDLVEEGKVQDEAGPVEDHAHGQPPAGEVEDPFKSPPGESYVFLGGSCNPTTWRKVTAIPKLQEAKIPFYDPQVANWHDGLVKLEADAKARSPVLLFVIDSATRAIASMLEATEYIAKNRVVVLVILDIPEGATFVEKFDTSVAVGKNERLDLNRARKYLRDIASRYTKTCSVFDDIETAIDFVIAYKSRSLVQKVLGRKPEISNRK